MGLGFSKGKSEHTVKQDLGPIQKIERVFGNEEIERNAVEIAQMVGEEAMRAAYQKTYELSKEMTELAKADIEKNLKDLEDEMLKLNELLNEKDEELNEKDKKICYLRQVVRSLQNECEEYKKRENELVENERKLEEMRLTLESEKKEVLGIGAPSYQARKMYGDTMPGDVTHEDVSKNFSEFFKYYIRNLPRENPSLPPDQVKESITPCFQKCFEISCQHALEIITEQTSTLFKDPSQFSEEVLSSFQVKEEQIDTSRAYSLLLYHARVKERKEEIIQQLIAKMELALNEKAKESGLALPGNFVKQAAKITWEMVTLVPPALSCTPAKYDKSYHEQRNSHWKVKEGPFQLVYHRPVLFFGNDGHIGLVAQVGNRECSPTEAVNFIEDDNDVDKEVVEHSQGISEPSIDVAPELITAKHLIPQILENAVSRLQNDANILN